MSTAIYLLPRISAPEHAFAQKMSRLPWPNARGTSFEWNAPGIPEIPYAGYYDFLNPDIGYFNDVIYRANADETQFDLDLMIGFTTDPGFERLYLGHNSYMRPALKGKWTNLGDDQDVREVIAVAQTHPDNFSLVGWYTSAGTFHQRTDGAIIAPLDDEIVGAGQWLHRPAGPLY